MIKLIIHLLLLFLSSILWCQNTNKDLKKALIIKKLETQNIEFTDKNKLNWGYSKEKGIKNICYNTPLYKTYKTNFVNIKNYLELQTNHFQIQQYLFFLTNILMMNARVSIVII